MRGVHVPRRQRLSLGSIVTSDQGHGASFAVVWRQYRSVAEGLGLVLPGAFGYAYPVDARYGRMSSKPSGYLVEAPDDRVIGGNLDYSIYAVMDWGWGEYVRHIRDLDERKAARDALLRERATKYFTELVPDRIELISDSWKVVGVHDGKEAG